MIRTRKEKMSEEVEEGRNKSTNLSSAGFYRNGYSKERNGVMRKLFSYKDERSRRG